MKKTEIILRFESLKDEPTFEVLVTFSGLVFLNVGDTLQSKGDTFEIIERRDTGDLITYGCAITKKK